MYDQMDFEEAQILTSLKLNKSWNNRNEESFHHNCTQTRLLNSRGKQIMSLDEKSKRSRERNKIHARLTRVRKKNAAQALQDYLFYLWSEVQFLRQMHQDYDTSMSLLEFSKNSHQTSIKIESDVQREDIEDYLVNGMSGHLDLKVDDLENFKSLLETHLRTIANANLDSVVLPDPKTTKDENILKMRGLSPQEINKVYRRERNRLHAKLTRDRKKIIHKLTETSIKELEREAHRLRQLLIVQGFPLFFYKDKLKYGSRLDCFHHILSTPRFKHSLGLNNIA